MGKQKIEFDSSQVSKEIADFEMGFARLSVQDRVEDAVCAGSGTLVKVGSMHGILTAAHVGSALPDKGRVGVVLHRKRSFELQRQMIEMQHVSKLTIAGDKFGPRGPDLGFIRLPPEDIGWIKALGSFYNLSKRREDVLAGKVPTSHYFDTISGMIDERTIDITPLIPSVRSKNFEAIFCGGQSGATVVENGYELFDFEVMETPGFALPSSFEGASGGAVWRLYCDVNDDKTTVMDKRLFGIPFYQSVTANKKRIITCHGPKSIYGLLLDKIAEQWPEESA